MGNSSCSNRPMTVRIFGLRMFSECEPLAEDALIFGADDGHDCRRDSFLDGLSQSLEDLISLRSSFE